jgi:hypothetical protein
MKKLLLLLILSFFSAQSIAKIGDVYYCNMTKFVGVLPDKPVVNYKLETFKFKWTEDSMVFSGNGYLGNSEVPITMVANMTTELDFFATDPLNMMATFGKGILSVVQRASPIGFHVIIADCSAF